MTEITVDVYGGEAEFSSYIPGNTELMLRFSTPLDGFLTVSSKTFAVSHGKCIFKLTEIEDGEHSPKFLTEGGFIRLPRLIKDGKTIYPKPFDDDYIRSLSKRERELEAQVKSLEEKVERLMKSVYGTSIFC
jgi:predicted thioredoxin/glutaredoxin